MRRSTPIRSTGHVEASPETAAPPHPERPDAADHIRSRPRRRLARSARLAAAVAGVAVVAAGCSYDAPFSILGRGSQAAAPPAASAASAASAPAATPPGTPPVEHWYALAQCETGGNWAAPGPTYVGGLGMWYGNWAAHGGLQYAPSADLATPEQQIAVATNLWLAGGSWGCKIGDGWDRR